MIDKEIRRKKVREYREVRKKLGLCRDCKNKTIDGKVRCPECTKKHSKRCSEYKKNNNEKMRKYWREYRKKRYYYKRDVYKNEDKL